MFPEEIYYEIFEYLKCQDYYSIFLSNRNLNGAISKFVSKKYNCDIRLLMKETFLPNIFFKNLELLIKKYSSVKKCTHLKGLIHTKHIKPYESGINISIVQYQLKHLKGISDIVFLCGILINFNYYHVAFDLEFIYLLCTNLISNDTEVLCKLSKIFLLTNVDIFAIDNILIIISVGEKEIMVDVFSLTTQMHKNKKINHKFEDAPTIKILTNENGDIVINLFVKHTRRRKSNIFRKILKRCCDLSQNIQYVKFN